MGKKGLSLILPGKSKLKVKKTNYPVFKKR